MGLKEQMLNDLKYEDLPENFKYVADAIGLDMVKQLILELGGSRIDIPQLRSLKGAVARFVANKPSSVPIRKVAQELSLTERHLRKLQSTEQRGELFKDKL